MIKWTEAYAQHKKYPIGMYGGKFIPFHVGHRYCLTVASILCEHVYCILFYGGDQELEILKNKTTLDSKYLDLEWRKNEVKKICAQYDNVTPVFIDVTALKDANGKEDWDAETPLVLEACGKLNAAFSSEPNYDEYFKRAYPWAEHVLVDPPRYMWPISATMLRGMNEDEAKEWLCE